MWDRNRSCQNNASHGFIIKKNLAGASQLRQFRHTHSTPTCTATNIYTSPQQSVPRPAVRGPPNDIQCRATIPAAPCSSLQ